jgi:hypothetical protein
MSYILSIFLGYLEAHFGRLELWLRDWKIVVNTSKSRAVLFLKAKRLSQKPRLMQYLG